MSKDQIKGTAKEMAGKVQRKARCDRPVAGFNPAVVLL